MAFDKMELPLFFNEAPTPRTREGSSSWVGKLTLLHRSPLDSEAKIKDREIVRSARQDEDDDAKSIIAPQGCAMTLRRPHQRSLSTSCMGPVAALAKGERPSLHAKCRDSVNSLIDINNHNEKVIAALREKLRRAEEDLQKECVRAEAAEGKQRELEELVILKKREVNRMLLERKVEKREFRAFRQSVAGGARTDGEKDAGKSRRRMEREQSLKEAGIDLKESNAAEVNSMVRKDREEKGKGNAAEASCSASLEVSQREEEVEELKVAHRKALVAWKEAEADRQQMREKLTIAEEKVRKLAAENVKHALDVEAETKEKLAALSAVESANAAIEEAELMNDRFAEELVEKEEDIQKMREEICGLKERMGRMDVEKGATEGEMSVLSRRLAVLLLEMQRQKEEMNEQRAEVQEALEKADKAKLEKMEARNTLAVVEGQKLEMAKKMAALEERIARISDVEEVADEDPQAETAAQMEKIAGMAEEIGRLQLQVTTKEEAVMRVAERNRELTRNVNRVEEQRKDLEQHLCQLKEEIGRLVEDLLQLARGEKVISPEVDGQVAASQSALEISWHRQKLTGVMMKLKGDVQKLNEEKEAQLQHLGIVLQGKEAAIAQLVNEVYALKQSGKSKDDSAGRIAAMAERLEEAERQKEEMVEEIMEVRAAYSEEVRRLLRERETEGSSIVNGKRRCWDCNRRRSEKFKAEAAIDLSKGGSPLKNGEVGMEIEKMEYDGGSVPSPFQKEVRGDVGLDMDRTEFDSGNVESMVAVLRQVESSKTNLVSEKEGSKMESSGRMESEFESTSEIPWTNGIRSNKTSVASKNEPSNTEIPTVMEWEIEQASEKALQADNENPAPSLNNGAEPNKTQSLSRAESEIESAAQSKIDLLSHCDISGIESDAVLLSSESGSSETDSSGRAEVEFDIVPIKVEVLSEDESMKDEPFTESTDTQKPTALKEAL